MSKSFAFHMSQLLMNSNTQHSPPENLGKVLGEGTMSRQFLADLFLYFSLTSTQLSEIYQNIENCSGWKYTSKLISFCFCYWTQHSPLEKLRMIVLGGSKCLFPSCCFLCFSALLSVISQLPCKEIIVQALKSTQSITTPMAPIIGAVWGWGTVT